MCEGGQVARGRGGGGRGGVALVEEKKYRKLLHVHFME